MSMALQSLLSMDDEIISGISGNNQNRRRAEDQLFRKYFYFINEGVRKYSFSRDEAFDVYSDTILVAIEKICDGAFERRSSLKSYIFQIFHNKSLDAIRKKKTNKNKVNITVPEAGLSGLSDAAKTIVEKMMEKSEWETLKLKLEELGENCRKLLLLWADGYADREIVESLEYKTADVVKTSRLRCLEKLRRSYRNDG